MMANHEEHVTEAGELWLNVASSYCVLERFINLDNHLFLRLPRRFPRMLVPAKYRLWVDRFRDARKRAILVRHDCRKPLPFDSGSASHILCSHFLEHIYPSEALEILRDFNRVLRTGGTIHIIVPDLAVQVAEYIQAGGLDFAADRLQRQMLVGPEQQPTMKFRVLELIGGFGLQHRWMYDRSSMATRLSAGGFSVVDQLDTPSSHFRMEYGSLHLFGIKP